MTVTTPEFNARWASGRHIGAYRPTQAIYIRTGVFRRSYSAWPGPAINAKLPKESAEKPWMANWLPTSDWVQLPGVQLAEVTQDFSQKGVAVATVTIDNTLLREATHLGLLYHYMDRGALSPWRSYRPPNMPGRGPGANEWYEKLIKNAQIKVFQGYGDEMMPVFTGMLDDVDLSSKPNKIVVTARDYGGQTLVDQKCFGFVNSPAILDPTIFGPPPASKGLTGTGVSVGSAPKASSTRSGHPARFILDNNVKTFWISQDHSDEGVTEWVEIRVPKGRYESIVLHPHYANMELFIGVYARNRLLGGENCELDDMNIPDGWVSLPEDEGGGMVPGAHGGWPYIKRIPRAAKAGKSILLGHKLELGDGSIFRLGMRNLSHIQGDTYRGGVARFKAVKRKGKSIRLKKVGFDADASSRRDGYHERNVLDASTTSRWISDDRSTPDVTEWVEIHVPQGRYDSIELNVPYDHMEAWIGVYARPRRRKKKNGQYSYYPSQVDDVDAPNGVEPGFLALGNGVVPGATNGGWPWVKHIPDLRKTPKHKVESFDLGPKFELGHNSVIRIAFRNLTKVGDHKYRASVSKFKARTRSGVKQPDLKAKKEEDVKRIEVIDASDIVRVVLRWAGFKEWSVENTGAKLKGDWVFNRQQTLMDIIDKVAQATGYVFFMDAPSDSDMSLGIPTFRSPMLLRDDLPGIMTVKDTDLLTGIDAKITDEPLAHIVRVRGAGSKTGQKFGSDRTKRFMSTYTPPWTRNDRLGGILRHVVHNQFRLADQQSVEVMARLIALQEALAAATATIEIPGHPGFGLDWQVGLEDTGTGLVTRLYVARRTLVFQAGKQASWKTTLGGSLLDTPDIVGVKSDLAAIVPPTQAIGMLSDETIGLEE